MQHLARDLCLRLARVRFFHQLSGTVKGPCAVCQGNFMVDNLILSGGASRDHGGRRPPVDPLAILPKLEHVTFTGRSVE